MNIIVLFNVIISEELYYIMVYTHGSGERTRFRICCEMSVHLAHPVKSLRVTGCLAVTIISASGITFWRDANWSFRAPSFWSTNVEVSDASKYRNVSRSIAISKYQTVEESEYRGTASCARSTRLKNLKGREIAAALGVLLLSSRSAERVISGFTDFD